MTGKRSLAIAAVAVLALGGTASAAKKKPKRLDRPDDPVVLTGHDLPRLVGAPPYGLAAYRFKAKGKGKWVRVPVQVDERALVDFGTHPGNNAIPGTPGSVYGNGAPTSLAALQYVDPGTFTDRDQNPWLDFDDEVAMMAFDAGAKVPKGFGPPPRVNPQGATAITIKDPVGGGRGWIYLFRAGSKLKPLKTDYVDYDFRLVSGDYKTTYRRADGPNPETSTVRTADYRAGYSDRWFLDTLAIDAGSAGGQDVLDGFKSGFVPGNCGRSEATYNDAEGAFVANIDGPVRAIRSYVGANSGPRTERTDVFYRSRFDVRIDLRVHPIASILSYIDMGPGALGMTYRSNLVPGGVPVDGVNDAVPAAPASWHLWSGAPGSLFSASAVTASFATGAAAGFYRDEQNTSITQCWGDDDLYGSAGTFVDPPAGIPNTDPSVSPTATLHAEAINVVGAPGTSAGDGDLLSRRVHAGPQATAKRAVFKKKN